MKQLKNTIIKYHYWLEFLLLIVLAVFFEISFRIRFGLKIFKYLFLSQIGNIIVVTLLLLFRSKKRRFISYMVFLAFAVGLFIADTCLYFYKKDLFSIAMFMDIFNGFVMVVRSMGNYNIFAAFPFYYWIITFSLLGLVVYGLYFLVFNGGERPKFMGRERLLLAIAIFAYVITLNGLSTIFVNTNIDERIYDAPQDKRTFVQTFGLHTYRTRDFVYNTYQLIARPLEKGKYQDIVDSITTRTPMQSNKHGLFENKNLILILCETCEDYAVDEKLTPNLYNILYGDNSFRFTNMYTSAKLDYTYDAEFKALTSMMYFNNDNYMYTYDHNTFSNSLPSVLKAKGYKVNSFHGFTGRFFNRKNMHKALGFEYYYANEDMNLSNYPSEWPLDSEMFAQMKHLYAPTDLDRPFFSFIISVTAHGDHDDIRQSFVDQGYYDIIETDGRFANREIQFKNILAGLMDLDKGLGIMFDHLRNNNLLDDTVIVLFADHKNYSSFDELSHYSPISQEGYEHEHDKVPYAIYYNQLEGQTIDLLTSHYDITPTLLDLFGVKYYKEFYYGQSVFLDETGEYEKKLNIVGYNRWIGEDIVLLEKDLVYIDDNVEDIEDYIYQYQVKVIEEIEKFHSFFYLDFFKDNLSYAPFNVNHQEPSE